MKIEEMRERNFGFLSDAKGQKAEDARLLGLIAQQWAMTAELCARQERTNELLEALLEVLGDGEEEPVVRTRPPGGGPMT